jgi:homoserine O-acetyltransferase/O-succinyltransferase
VRLWRDILNLLAARTPDMYQAQFKTGTDVLPWMTQQEDAVLTAFDANDWIYRTWAYEKHDVGTTPGFNGGHREGARLDQGEDVDPHRHQGPAAKAIKNVLVVTISPGTVTGHASAGGDFPADVEFLNHETVSFLEGLNPGGSGAK